MTGKTAIIVAGTSGAEIAARVAAAIGDERRLRLIDEPGACVEEIVGDEVPDRVSIERP